MALFLHWPLFTWHNSLVYVPIVCLPWTFTLSLTDFPPNNVIPHSLWIGLLIFGGSTPPDRAGGRRQRDFCRFSNSLWLWLSLRNSHFYHFGVAAHFFFRTATGLLIGLYSSKGGGNVNGDFYCWAIRQVTLGPWLIGDPENCFQFDWRTRMRLRPPDSLILSVWVINRRRWVACPGNVSSTMTSGVTGRRPGAPLSATDTGITGIGWLIGVAEILLLSWLGCSLFSLMRCQTTNSRHRWLQSPRFH